MMMFLLRGLAKRGEAWGKMEGETIYTRVVSYRYRAVGVSCWLGKEGQFDDWGPGCLPVVYSLRYWYCDISA